MADKKEQIELLDSFEEELNKLFDKAIEARDMAQKVSTSINKLKQSLTTKKLKILGSD